MMLRTAEKRRFARAIPAFFRNFRRCARMREKKKLYLCRIYKGNTAYNPNRRIYA